MKLSLKMIQQYVKVDMDAQTYADRMIMTGTGVESVDDVSNGMEKVVVGRVLTCEAVEGTHLHQCTVDIGSETPLQIVCGAPNCEAGILTPVALDGAKLPGGVKIKKGKLRGMLSEGMLCSADELKIPQDLYPSCGAEGLLIFEEDVPVGTDIRSIVGLDDTVLDFEILANRPDCLSCIGIARETAAVLGTEFVQPEPVVTECGGDIHEEVSVRVENEELCPRYTARVIKNVRIAPSPLWLRSYLHAVGLRSINNIVDITNYVMVEYGHPMHAFDLSKVRGRQIVVRNAHEGENLTTLDGTELVLRSQDLVICDAERATGLAGIMGGEESEITEATTEVMFECAAFDRTAVRLTSRAHGIRTDASGKFERGVNPCSVMDAMNRACELITMLNAGDVVSGCIDIWPHQPKQQVITASVQRIQERSGVADMPAEAMVDIIRRLHFGCERNGDTLTVTVPSFREDLDGEADICEECLRMYGYDHIASTSLIGLTTQGAITPMQLVKHKISDVLGGLNYLEIMNFSFTARSEIEKLGLPQDDLRNKPMEIRNPLGDDTAVMRTTLVPSMLRTLAFNMNHATEAANLYEMAAVFDPHHRTEEGLPTETQMLCMGSYGPDIDFYAVRCAVETVLHGCGIEVEVVSGGDAYYHPGRVAHLMHDDVEVATIGEIHPKVQESFELPKRCVVAEINLRTVLEYANFMGKMKPLPHFPAMLRDLALVMDERTQVGPLMKAMRKASGKYLENIEMFDVYRGLQVGLGKKSVAFSLAFRADDHTLTDEEIQQAMNKVLKEAEEKFGAILRA